LISKNFPEVIPTDPPIEQVRGGVGVEEKMYGKGGEGGGKGREGNVHA
jgi:hypothetical protein